MTSMRETAAQSHGVPRGIFGWCHKSKNAHRTAASVPAEHSVSFPSDPAHLCFQRLLMNPAGTVKRPGSRVC